MTDLVARASTDIDAGPHAVWRALTDPEQIREYLFGTEVRSAWTEDAEITWSGEWQGEPYEDRGRILVYLPESRLKMTHWSPLSGVPDTAEHHHVLTWELTELEHGVRLTVTQENTADEATVAESEKTWATVLDGLRRVAEAHETAGDGGR